jgi:hypothetical protein
MFNGLVGEVHVLNAGHRSWCQPSPFRAAFPRVSWKDNSRNILLIKESQPIYSWSCQQGSSYFSLPVSQPIFMPIHGVFKSLMHLEAKDDIWDCRAYSGDLKVIVSWTLTGVAQSMFELSRLFMRTCDLRAYRRVTVDNVEDVGRIHGTWGNTSRTYRWVKVDIGAFNQSMEA